MANIRFGKYEIKGSETYFLAYAGGKRELQKKDQDNYNKIIALPMEAQRMELKKLGFEKNPDVVPIRGDKLIEVIRDKKLVPFFDRFFDQSHLLQINDIIVFESLRAKSYEIAMGKR